jgi:hypothetical protein
MTSIATDLVELLDAVRRPGDFCTSGTIELLAPSLEVEGVGPVALPLLPLQAEQIAAAAEQAPYGRGQDTLVDTAVRRTWQIGPDKVRITGRHWQRTLEAILQRVSQGLGVDDPIEAEFYKLLLYDAGSFFVSHRDTEKAPGMFATLVIVLPSQCRGGELVVRHQGRESRLDLRCDDPAEASFAAFYADCPHEVLPVAAGCRLTLVYNVLRRGRGNPPEPPDYSVEQTRAAALLRQWSVSGSEVDTDDDVPLKLVHLLEHAYTPAEIGFHTLKGADAAAANVLAAAARQSGCDLHLALLTREESGSAEYNGSYRRGRRYGDDDDDEFEVGEIFDWTVRLSEWRSLDGTPPPFSEIPVMEEELSPPDAFEDLEPDEIHFQEATGNAGASFERTYRRAALVLWPHDSTFAVLCQAGLAATLPYLEDMTQRWTDGGSDFDSPLRRDAHDLADHMIEQWPKQGWNPRRDDTPTDATRMLAALTRLQDIACIESFLTGVTAAGVYTRADNPAILGALGLLPREAGVALIERIVRATGATAFAACADLLARATAAAPDHARSLCSAASALIDALPSHAGSKQPWEEPRSKVEASFIVDLQTALAGIDEAMADRAVARILALPQTYDPDAVLIPAAKLLQGVAHASPAGSRLHAACLAHLRARIAEPLAPPPDWRRPSAVGCRCVHCTELSRYLADPARETWIFKAVESDRGHVEGTIHTARCDVDMATDRRGRPYSLICIKNQASYERRAKQRAEDTENLAVLTR